MEIFILFIAKLINYIIITNFCYKYVFEIWIFFVTLQKVLHLQDIEVVLTYLRI